MSEATYSDFLETKVHRGANHGIAVDDSAIHARLFPFQRVLARWALRKGRAALFADTGLGKTLMQLEWARLTGEHCLIVAPLSVARQTVREAATIDVPIVYARSHTDAPLVITNYEMVDHFDPSAFGAVVLDESSILKAFDGKTRNRLTAMFADTPLRLCCTATPAPNDIAEIGNHSEFLGVLNRTDMLARFFVHDDEGWRLKKHAHEPFYQWLASWSMSVRLPSDIGYSDDGYILPPVNVSTRYVEADVPTNGKLFFTGLDGITGRATVRRASMEPRVTETATIVNGTPGQWIVWCGMNDESSALARLIPGSIEVVGSDTPEYKAESIEAFQDGKWRVMITKARIAGMGMNLQNCHQMVFAGLSDSFEQFYQAIRRCYRFGQESPVDVRIVLSEAEEAIYHNVMRKQKEADRMSEELLANVAEFEKDELGIDVKRAPYLMSDAREDGWHLMLGDSAERLVDVESDSVGLSVFSPPFLSLYTYSPSERDLGNSATPDEFFGHFGFIIRELLRVTMPGRNVCCHVAQVPALLSKDGYIGMKDFRGQTIVAFESNGFVYHGEVCIDKDPQAQAIRTHSKGLLFTQLRKDASWIRPAMADYILVFRKPGENPAAIHPDISNDEWIEWARPIWYGIRESETLQARAARGADDERHICPLQLGTIERCIRLWSNRRDLVLDPFAGIGSTGYQAVKYDRRFVGIELKREYFEVAVSNLRQAISDTKELTLFDLNEVG